MGNQEDFAKERFVECILFCVEYVVRRLLSRGVGSVLGSDNKSDATDLLDQEEVAQILGVSRAQVRKYELLKSDPLNRVKNMGRSARYTRREVERFKRKRE